MSALRHTQLDGWRAFAVLGVMWLHWTPPGWRGPVPVEIGLFFFFTLTGFLITRALLRDRDAGERWHRPWRRMAIRHFFKRRAIRILVPCYAALLFAWLAGAPDLRAHPWPYVAHYSNFHVALSPGFPSGTAHYWTLAIQMQFYLLWPLLIYFAPRRALLPALVAVAALAPLSRWVLLHHFPQVVHDGAITTSTADFFAAGALLALAVERGMKAGDRRVGAAAWAAFGLYVVLYAFDISGRPLAGVRHFQQTLLAVAFAGLISASLHGIPGVFGRVLDHPAAQHLGRLSYGLYLFHAPMPLALGYVMPFLWHPVFDGPLLAVRLAVFALASWGAAWLCWRYLEQSLDRFRQPARPA